jgi:hypothetical protein
MASSDSTGAMLRGKYMGAADGGMCVHAQGRSDFAVTSADDVMPYAQGVVKGLSASHEIT